MSITKQDIELAKSDDADVWAFGDRVLYELCRDYPEHKDVRVVVAKIWLIGR